MCLQGLKKKKKFLLDSSKLFIFGCILFYYSFIVINAQSFPHT